MLSCQFLIYSLHLTAFTSCDDVHLSLLAEAELTLTSRGLFSSSTNLPSGKRAVKTPRRAHLPNNWSLSTEKTPCGFVCLSAFMTLLAFLRISSCEEFQGRASEISDVSFHLANLFWHMTTATCFMYGAEPPCFPEDNVEMISIGVFFSPLMTK